MFLLPTQNVLSHLHLHLFLYFHRTISPTQEPTSPPIPSQLLPTTMKPTWGKPPWNPGWPHSKPPSWDSGWPPSKPSWNHGKPSFSYSWDVDDWVDDWIYPEHKPPPEMKDDDDDDDWRPIFPGKSSKTKSSKWGKGSKSSKSSKSGCVYIGGGKYLTEDGYPCTGYYGVSGKSAKRDYAVAGYSIIDFQSVVVKSSGERIQSHSVGLSLALLFCLSMLL